MTELGFSISTFEAFPLEAPISTPRRNAFGIQSARHALFVRLTLEGGATGWGEVFANWPAFAGPYRARVVTELLAPRVVGKAFTSPADLWRRLTDETTQIAIQCGEPGPFAAAIAGVEIASWSALASERATPLSELLGTGGRSAPIPYASGIAPEAIEALVPSHLEDGWTAFKLKVGFGAEIDRNALKHLRDLVGPEADVMVDANMAWTPANAPAAIDALAEFDLTWVEEPIRADCRPEDWARLAEVSASSLAAGENLRGRAAFASALEAGVGFLQPDPVKWGGLSGCMEIAEMAREAGAQFAPHFLGGAVGLEATRALAEAGGASYVEIDVTENPLRGAFGPYDRAEVEQVLAKFAT
ncbi:mandelate racemase/muconate lactonizing enzyme [Rhodobacteraceae bacterium KLH11]|nr:mandelate racemase/muconate lactonizing enzyme [Rhodobacteraceae bacterium KLH11]